MSKLLELNEYMAIQDAAKHLSTAFETEITKADAYEFALNRGLQLSVYFQNQKLGWPCVTLPDGCKWRGKGNQCGGAKGSQSIA